MFFNSRLLRNTFIIIGVQLFMASVIFANTANFTRARQLFDLSIQQFRRNNLSEAVELINRAIRLDNTNYVYHYNLGAFNLKMKNYDEAIDKFLTALKYQADHQESFYNIGLCYFYKNDYLKAADYFKQAISINQYDIDAQINLGLAYKNLNQYDAAVIQYQKALMIDPENTAALVNLAVIYKLKNELQRSADAFNKVLEIEPDNTEALYNLGLLREALEKQKTQAQTFVSQPADAQAAQPQSEGAVLTHKSSITGKDVSLPLDFKESVKPAVTVKADIARPLNESSDIKISVSRAAADSSDDFKKLKTELLADIRLELNNFLSEFKKITAGQFKTPAYSDFSFDNFGLNSGADISLFSTPANDFSFSSSDFEINDIDNFSAFGLTDNYGFSFETNGTADNTGNFSVFDSNFENNDLSAFSGLSAGNDFSNDGLLNFSGFNSFDADLNSATYWTGANSGLDNYDDFLAPASSAKQTDIFGGQLDFSIDNNSDFDGLINFDSFFNNIQPADNSFLQIEPLNIDAADNFVFEPELDLPAPVISQVQPLAQQPAVQTAANPNAINLNTDSEQALTAKGLPSNIARNIVWYRSNVSKFTMLEDFMTLPEVTSELFGKFKNKIIY